MRILVAPDKFKGTASAAAAAAALRDGLVALGHEVLTQPMADGGEGTLEVLGGPNRSTLVTGPLGDGVDAAWRLSRRVAVIEMAAASGLSLVDGDEGNDAVAASTSGTGELIAAAADAGARRIIVGVGGSASTDGGLGALRAMHPIQRFRGLTIEVACDVRTHFVDAARIFAPQKGASPAQVQLLERRLQRLVQVYADDYGVDVATTDGSGAAGGLAGGLLAAGAELIGGFELVSDRVDLDAQIEQVDLVVTGEGFLDEESFDGKVVGGVVELCAELAVPVVAVVGEAFDGASARVASVSLVDEFGRGRSMLETLDCLRASAQPVIDRARRST